MKYANEKYITVRHPISGAGVQAIPTGEALKHLLTDY